MKISILLGLTAWTLLVAHESSADVPKQIHLQGILSNASGPLADSTVSVEFKLYDDPSAGIVKWSETHIVLTDEVGRFGVYLGAINPIADTVFIGSGRWLGIKVATDPEMSPRQRVASTAYAFEFDNTGPDSVVAENVTTSSANLATAFFGRVSGTTSGGALYGLRGLSQNLGSGGATGGYFVTLVEGTGPHIGVYGSGQGASDAPTYGTLGRAHNTSTGDAFGGHFTAPDFGSGNHYGVYAEGEAAIDTAYGVYGKAINTSGGPAVGGHFESDSVGTGLHIGVSARTTSSSVSSAAIGVQSLATGASSGAAYGAVVDGKNLSSGDVYGGKFTAVNGGTGDHFGIHGSAYSSSGWASAVQGLAVNTSAERAWGGYFTASGDGSGSRYGVSAFAEKSQGGSSYGVFARVEDTTSPATGSIYGGRFEVIDAGVVSAYAVYGDAMVPTSGSAYGGYFITSSGGVGTHYGVYASEPAGGTGAAVYAAGDFVASGTKSAVLKTSQGEALYYSMESPEVLFEDFGTGRLSAGRAHIDLDPMFLETVTITESHPLRVFVQLNDDCEGMYVKAGMTGFDVIELRGGKSNAAFSYRVVAKRKGHELKRSTPTTVGQSDPNLYPELWAELKKQADLSGSADAAMSSPLQRGGSAGTTNQVEEP